MNFKIGMPRRCSHNLMILGAKQSDVNFKPITFPMGIMKPIAAKWIMDAVHYIYTHPVLIRNGFRAAGITDTISDLSWL